MAIGTTVATKTLQVDVLESTTVQYYRLKLTQCSHDHIILAVLGHSRFATSKTLGGTEEVLLVAQQASHVSIKQ